MASTHTLNDLPLSAPIAADRQMSQIVWASVLGTVVEWYDFLIYGTAAALVFNKLFFPSLAAAAGTLAAFGTYAVGFVARPLGGAIFGHFGDRIGRKAMLMLTMMIMGMGTFLIGLPADLRRRSASGRRSCWSSCASSRASASAASGAARC